MNVSITCVRDKGKAILTFNLVYQVGEIHWCFAFSTISDTQYILLLVMHLILLDDHLPLVAPDFVCADSAAKMSLGEGLMTGVFVRLSPAFVQKPSEQAALTDSTLIPQTHL